MILVFIFLGLIIIFSSICLLLVMSTIKIKVDNLRIINFKINKEYKIFIELYLLNKVRYLSIKIDNRKLKKISSNMKLDKFNNINMPSKKDIIYALRKLKIKLEELNLRLNIGIDDASLLSYIVASVSSIISIIMPYVADNKKKIRYLITPQYNKNVFDFNLKSIISIKIVHIIYVIYILVKKGRINYERTSDRRSYAYGYEQY